jgi:hypothetical protein
MGGARKFSVLLLALACAAALSACGGGSSTATTAGGTAQATTAPAETTEGGGSKGSSNGGGSGGGGSSEQGSSGAESASSHERSSSFRTPGGDNSIQEFGGEGGAEERAKATKTITIFFSATKNNEWAKVCGVLATKTLAQMEQFAEKIPKVKSRTCAGVIEVINSSAAPSEARPETIKGPVISLRREGNQGFALYHGIDGKNYAFPLVLEKGEWKMTSLGATPLSF